MESTNHAQLVIHNSSTAFLPEAEHSTTWLPAWGSQRLVSDRKKLGQSAIGIALYQMLVDTFLDLINYTYPHDTTIV